MCQCGAHEGQKRVSDSPGAGVIQGDTLPDTVLGTKLRPSARAVRIS